MFNAVYNMFAPSPRPIKRQRTNRQTPEAEATPVSTSRTTRSAGRRNNSHAPQAGPSTNGNERRSEASSTQLISGSGSGNSSKPDFVDSAYQSMGTSPENDEGDDHLSENTQTPTTRGMRSRKTRERTSAIKKAATAAINSNQDTIYLQSRKQEKHKASAVNEDARGDVEEADDTTLSRSGRRTRTKTWKVSELDSKAQKDETDLTMPRKDEQNASSPVSHGSRRKSLGAAQKLGTPADRNAKKTPLKMPKKRDNLPEDNGNDDVPQDEEVEILPVQSKGKASAKRSNTAEVKKSSAKADSKSSLEVSQIGKMHTLDHRKANIIGVELGKMLAKSKYKDILLAAKNHIMNHLTARGPLPICGEGHYQAYQKIYQILEQTITAGEGNSVLLIGARSTAKSVIVDTALRELSSDFKDQFHTIRLNGFLHTDDKLALKEIWRQLGKEMAVEDDSMNDRTNYADTLASLLALLSQPEELPMSEDTRTTSKSVIFVMDEFDLFTTHPRQTLLYNLFDIAQSRKAPIAVLGLTTRIDIVESLEKRVKSRFSHRYVHVSHPKTLTAYTEVIRAFLLASFNEGDKGSDKVPALDDLKILHAAEFPQFHAEWSSYIENLLSNPSVRLLLHRHYSQSKSPQSFLNALLLPIAKLPILTQPADLFTNSLAAPDSNLHLLQSLSDASLALLISAARLDIICDTDTVTFNMAYDEYVRLAQRSRLTASASGMIAVSGSTSGGTNGLLGRDVALSAWEQLEEIALLLPIAGQGGQTQGASVDLGRGGRLVRVDIGLEEIGSTVGSELGPMLKWCKEI